MRLSQIVLVAIVLFSATFVKAMVDRTEWIGIPRVIEAENIEESNAPPLPPLAESSNPTETSQNTAQMQCTCHALDPQFETACHPLSITQCHRVGNIVCIPRCR